MEKELTLVDHLTELRNRIIWTLVFFVIFMLLGFWLSGYLIDFVKSRPPANEFQWQAISPSDGVRVYLQFAFIIGFAFTLPFLLYQIWAFVSPGLKPEERNSSRGFIPAAVVLFLIGLSFAYFVVFPMIFGFISDFTTSLHAKESYGIAQYFGFMFNIILPLALLFELPIIVMFLTKLRILNPLWLSKFRRYAYFILIVVGTMITPPEIISDLLVSLPLLLLYEFSIWLSRIVYRKQLARDREKETEDELASDNEEI